MTSAVRSVPLVASGDPRARIGDPGGRWLAELRLVEPVGRRFEHRTAGDVESALLVLGGTFDLGAGQSSWARRGVRTDPLDGPPVCVYLPPDTVWHAAEGHGRILLVSARRPAPPELSPRERVASKGLLPMAGSGKAFDPTSGSWRPRESFADAPEAILPRHIESLELGSGARLRRVLPGGYKSLGLCLDELTLDAGAAATVPPPIPGTEHPAETLVYVFGEDRVAVGDATFAGEGIAIVAGAPPPIRALGGRGYAALFYGGPKSST